MQNGFILDRDYTFWKGFIVGGDFDEAKLLEANYTKAQHAGIRKEASDLGWIGEGKAKREREVQQTILGRDRMFWAGHVDSGVLNVEKLRTSKYTEAQIEKIVAGFEEYGWAKVPKDAVKKEAEKEVDAIPEGFPRKEQLEAAGVNTLSDVRMRAEAGTLQEVEGIGPAGERDIREALGMPTEG